MAVKQPAQPKLEANGKAENGVLDIEETVRDVELETKNLEKILDKTRLVNSILAWLMVRLVMVNYGHTVLGYIVCVKWHKSW